MLLDYILLLLRPEEPIAMGKVENQKKKKMEKEETKGERGRRKYCVFRAPEEVNHKVHKATSMG